MREPRKHSKLYDEVTSRLMNGDPQLFKSIKDMGNFMIDHALSFTETRRLISYLEERHRWSKYNADLHGAIQLPDAPPDYCNDDENCGSCGGDDEGIDI